MNNIYAKTIHKDYSLYPHELHPIT